MGIKEENILDIQGVSKSFPGVKALNKISFTVKKGEVRALSGENGAGKSTLIKILTGVYTSDSGQILFEGKPVGFHSTYDSQNAGIRGCISGIKFNSLSVCGGKSGFGRLPHERDCH